MTAPVQLEEGNVARYKADRSYLFLKGMDGQVATIRRIDESREDFQYWIETPNDAFGKWSGTWAARRELRKIPRKGVN